MKNRLLTVLAFVFVFSLFVFASESDNGLWKYETYGDGVELTEYEGSATDVYVPNYIEVEGTKLSVLKLGDGIFENNDVINSVTIGAGVKEIGDRAFYDADNMVCILLAEDTTTIGAEAFFSCDNFNSVILYDAVTAIGENAFAECPKLTVWCNEDSYGYNYIADKNIPFQFLTETAEPETVVCDGITYYVQNGMAIAIDFDESKTVIIVPANVNGYPVTELRETFRECKKITSVTLPSSLKKIGDNAFYYCSLLSSITIPYGVESIGSAAFRMCQSLEYLTIPGSVTDIADQAFATCTSLKKITIPDSITVIGSGVFSGCTALTDITIPDGVTAIGSSAFSRCTSLANVTISNGVTTIGKYAFSMCTSLTSITVPDSVINIESYAFEDCTSLTDAVIGDIISIDSYAFQDCTALTTVKIGDITSIGYSAFNRCRMLTNLEIDNVKSIDYDAFLSCTELRTVVIPQGTTTITSSAFYATTVLIVYENSYAHRYAINNGLLYFVYDGTSMPNISTVDGVTYYVMNDEAVAIDFDNSSTSVTIPSYINGYPVTELRRTFDGCKNLVSIVLPETLKIIGGSAFYTCKALESINIPDGVTSIGQAAFYGCETLKSITIPSGVQSITWYTFRYCKSLENVTISEGVKSIAPYAFDGTSLRTVCLPQSVVNLSENSFVPSPVFFVYDGSSAQSFCEKNDLLYVVYDGVNIPELVTYDGVAYCIMNGEAIAVDFDNSATAVTIPSFVNGYPVRELRKTFSGCENLVSVTLPDTLYSIGSFAFYNCIALESIIIPNSVTTIGESAFRGCYKLIYATIPDSVTTIGEWAFASCSSLVSVTIPKNLTKIEEYAFNYCSSLKTVTFCNNLQSIGVGAFTYCISLTSITIPDGVTNIESNAFSLCYSLTSIDIPNSVTSIGGQAFYSSGLRSVKIPENITSIGVQAFAYCKSLETVILSDSMTSISEKMFGGCVSLTSITLPNSITSVGTQAFYDCTSLKSVDLGSITSIGTCAFENCTSLQTALVTESVIGMETDSFMSNTILLVYEDSYAHTFAKDNNLLYFVLHKTENPEISYGAGLAGKVTYTDGSVASGATVEILYDDGTLKEAVTTDENGAYAFTYAEVGQYTIRATDANGNTSTATVSVKRMNVFDVFVAGDTNLTLKQSWTVSGTVSENKATVTIADEEGNVIDTVQTTDGTFAFFNIPNGTYILTASNENGSVSKEITVYNANVSGIELTLPTAINAATIFGYAEIEKRDGTRTRKAWINVTIYNADGVAVGQTKTDADGKFTFKRLPVDEYTIVAETTEMRADKKQGFDRSYVLTGYAYIKAVAPTEYQVDTIVLYEENDYKTKVSGKVTAEGETQDCVVIIRDVFRNEVARYTTGNNGKYSFVNVRDGLYFITATTKSDGSGMAVIVVRDGEVYGETGIRVSKKDEIRAKEDAFLAEVVCESREEVVAYRARIADEKRFYDSLSKKEKNQLSKEYVERLEQYVAWLAELDCNAPEGVTVSNSGLVVSGGEIENEETVSFNLTVEKQEGYVPNSNGINSVDDYNYYSMNDAAGNKEIKQYYEITMTKSAEDGEKEITSVTKDTDSNGSFLITMEIPEEYRGYKNYSILHEHHGEVITLVDLDDNPDTITFEVDKFSTFVLAASNEETFEDVSDEEVVGDVNGDGDLTVLDVILSLKALLDGTFVEADINADGEITLVDIIQLLKMLVS